MTSTIREDTGYSGLWMLDALQDAGYENLKHKTVTVLSDPSSHVDEQLAHDLVAGLRAADQGGLPGALRPRAGVRARCCPTPSSPREPCRVAAACAGMASLL